MEHPLHMGGSMVLKSLHDVIRRFLGLVVRASDPSDLRPALADLHRRQWGAEPEVEDLTEAKHRLTLSEPWKARKVSFQEVGLKHY